MSNYELLPPFENGKPVGFMYRGDEQEPINDGIMVDYYPDPQRHVWDEASGALRERRSDESLLEAKAEKRSRLIVDAETAYRREIPSFAGVVVAAKFVPPNNTQYLNARELTIFNKISAGYARLNTLLDQVDAATTLAEVEAVQDFTV